MSDAQLYGYTLPPMPDAGRIHSRAVSETFAGLEPAAFWRHFAALTTIPRPSHEEERVAAHVTAWAAERGFGVRSDAAGNLVIDVPATPGREDAPAVILQGHLDMVCERSRTVRTTRARAGSTSSATGTGCWPRARRSAPTTASRSRR